MTASTCPVCSGELLTSEGQTFCPACLLQQGMKSSVFGRRAPGAWQPPEIGLLSAVFPQLEIQQLLGQGGMGAVYKVRQKELDRLAALKILPGEMAADSGFTERFLREARLLASLSHPHIVTVYEFGQRDGIHFLLMEFVDGVTLRQAMLADPIRRLNARDALSIVGQLCEALQFAHDEGVVHRDIKPENILIDRRGRVKIADFGLARMLGQSATMPTLTRTHQLMGTPAYMAPEQIEGLPAIDHRADIYSMGVVFYELLTGELPLGRFSPPSERANTDVRLDEVVLRTLAREPDRRYQQASQVKVDVDALRSGVATGTAGAPMFSARKPRLSGRVSAFAFGALMTPLLFFILWTVLEWRYAAVRAAVAEQQTTILIDASRTKAAAREEQRRQETPAASAAEPGTLAGMPASSETAAMPGMGMPGMLGGEAQDDRPFKVSTLPEFAHGAPPITMTSDGPVLSGHAGASITPDQRLAANQILKETHQRYLKAEAQHTLITVDAAGTQQIEIRPFGDQLRVIENDMWTKLDDTVSIETQREFRTSLNLFGSPGQNSPMDGSMGMSSGGGSGSVMVMDMMSPGVEILPGLLGWQQFQLPVTLLISRSGRWFQWSIESKGSVLIREKTPELPGSLQRFFREPGPWLAIANARALYTMNDWERLGDQFTAGGQLREILRTHAEFRQKVRAAIEPGSSAAISHQQFYLREISRFPELRQWLPSDSAPQVDVELQIHELIARIPSVTPESLDALLLAELRKSPSNLLKNAFVVCAIILTADQNERWTSLMEHGEMSAWSEQGNSAAGMLTVPGQPSIPIRFLNENGQWRIDAVGSNEQFIEELKKVAAATSETPLDSTSNLPPDAESRPPSETADTAASEPASN